MKVLHLSSSDSGGAGIAALRLHRTMLKYKIKSSFLCLEKTSNLDSVIQYPKFYPRFYHRFFASIGMPITKSEKNYLRIKKIEKKIQPEMYSFPETDYFINKNLLFKQADVIIIHWVAGFLDYESFFKNIPNNKKIFWYAHDFSVMLGGFHTLFDESRFNDNLTLKQELKLKNRKRNYLSNYNKLNFIGNSHFTYKMLLDSNIANKELIHCVPLGIPKNELQKIEKTLAKRALGFSENHFLILNASTSISCKRKGFNRIHEVFNNLEDIKSECTIITLGSDYPNEANSSLNFRHMGDVWNTSFKSIIFSAADVLISTSYEETFGQTIIEGFACSTPAIVFNNSALKELIIPGETGYIADSIIDFAEFLRKMMANRDKGMLMGQSAYNIFDKYYTSKRQLSDLIQILDIKLSE